MEPVVSPEVKVTLTVEIGRGDKNQDEQRYTSYQEYEKNEKI